MEFIKKYANRLLEKKAKRVNREVALFDFSIAKNIGILWHIDDIKGFKHASKTLINKGFKFQGLCYREKQEQEIESSFGYKELNWLGLPKTGIVDTFVNTEFDLLLNISVVNSFPLTVATALSKAKFKCGWTNEPNNYFDLLIDISKNIDSVYLIKQQFHYLEQLTINSK